MTNHQRLQLIEHLEATLRDLRKHPQIVEPPKRTRGGQVADEILSYRQAADGGYILFKDVAVSRASDLASVWLEVPHNEPIGGTTISNLNTAVENLINRERERIARYVAERFGEPDWASAHIAREIRNGDDCRGMP
jgi:plasmid stabilization system protein ParE